MKLPNGSRAYIPPPKLSRYLLSEVHPVGRSKAKFFRHLGFHGGNTSLLEQGMLAIAQAANVVEVEETKFGTKYVLIGELATPIGQIVNVRTIWVIEDNTDRPRFVTAYPE